MANRRLPRVDVLRLKCATHACVSVAYVFLYTCGYLGLGLGIAGCQAAAPVSLQALALRRTHVRLSSASSACMRFSS